MVRKSMFHPLLRLLSCYLLLAVCSCQSSHESRITLTVSSARGLTVYLIKVPYFDGQEVILDSQKVVNAGVPLQFVIHDPAADQLYQFKIAKSFTTFSFIPDSEEITIQANNANRKMKVWGSPATQSLQQLQQRQQLLQQQAQKLTPRPAIGDTLVNAADNAAFDSLMQTISRNYWQYADTVTHAAAFMAAYQHIDFASDFEKMTSLLATAKKRFNRSATISRLYTEAQQLSSLFQYEYNVGDTLPHIELPDVTGQPFSTKALKNQYYFIDFWSVWCEACLPYNNAKQRVRNEWGNEKLGMVSVALDDDREAVLRYVQQQRFGWTQLVDEKMWLGTAAATIRFDSIPMNYLVAPGGRILAKAIAADSLFSVIRQSVR